MPAKSAYIFNLKPLIVQLKAQIKAEEVNPPSILHLCPIGENSLVDIDQFLESKWGDEKRLWMAAGSATTACGEIFILNKNCVTFYLFSFRLLSFYVIFILFLSWCFGTFKSSGYLREHTLLLWFKHFLSSSWLICNHAKVRCRQKYSISTCLFVEFRAH